MTRTRRLYDEILTDVLEAVRVLPGASTYEIMCRAGIEWRTADKYLSVLKERGQVTSRQRGKVTIWFIKENET